MYMLACDGSFSEFMMTDNFIAVTAIALGCSVGLVAIVGGTLTSVMRTRAREQTKRELAAYVAEGTIAPENAVAMLNAGVPKGWQSTPASGGDHA